MADDDDDSSVHSDDHGSYHPPTSTSVSPFMLSKSWKVQRSHLPIYTGGKIQQSTTTASQSHHHLLLPVHGNVVFVKDGQQVATVRENVEEEDDDGVDQDAITAYAMSQQNSLITASHNSMLRQYSWETDRSTTVQVIKSWGKSGHSLPITVVEFHVSGVYCATGSVDGTSKVWDVRRGVSTHVFRYPSERSAVTALQWMPQLEDLVVAVGRDDGTIVLPLAASSWSS